MAAYSFPHHRRASSARRLGPPGPLPTLSAPGPAALLPSPSALEQAYASARNASTPARLSAGPAVAAFAVVPESCPCATGHGPWPPLLLPAAAAATTSAPGPAHSARLSSPHRALRRDSSREDFSSEQQSVSTCSAYAGLMMACNVACTHRVEKSQQPISDCGEIVLSPSCTLMAWPCLPTTILSAEKSVRTREA